MSVEGEIVECARSTDWSHTEIAEVMGVSRQKVTAVVRRYEEVWQHPDGRMVKIYKEVREQD